MLYFLTLFAVGDVYMPTPSPSLLLGTMQGLLQQVYVEVLPDIQLLLDNNII